MTDQVVVVHHLLHGVGEREGDRQRQTLGDRDHENADGDNEELDKVVHVREVEHGAVRLILLGAEADHQHNEGQLNICRIHRYLFYMLYIYGTYQGWDLVSFSYTRYLVVFEVSFLVSRILGKIRDFFLFFGVF